MSNYGFNTALSTLLKLWLLKNVQLQPSFNQWFGDSFSYHNLIQ